MAPKLITFTAFTIAAINVNGNSQIEGALISFFLRVPRFPSFLMLSLDLHFAKLAPNLQQLQTNADVKLTALQQGVAYAPLAPEGDKFALNDIETTVTAVFNVNESATVQACGRQHVLGSGRAYMAATPSALPITTDQTRVMPTVQWNCKPGKNYTMVMHDAFTRPITNMTFGYTHWIKINIPCDSATATASSAGGITFGDAEYFQPDNFELKPHHYGFYILEQRGTTPITPTLVDISRFARAKLSNGISLRQFMEWVSDKGPIARTWADVGVSAWSAFSLQSAGFDVYSAIACGNMDMTMPRTKTVRVKTIPPASASPPPEKNKSHEIYLPTQDSDQHLVVAIVTSVIAFVYPFVKK